MVFRVTQTLSNVLAVLLNDAPPHYPYTLAKRSGAGQGAIYALLDRLEEQGFVQAFTEVVDPAGPPRPARRHFILTERGRQHARNVQRRRPALLVPADPVHPVALPGAVVLDTGVHAVGLLGGQVAFSVPSARAALPAQTMSRTLQAAGRDPARLYAVRRDAVAEPGVLTAPAAVEFVEMIAAQPDLTVLSAAQIQTLNAALAALPPAT